MVNTFMENTFKCEINLCNFLMLKRFRKLRLLSSFANAISAPCCGLASSPPACALFAATSLVFARLTS